MDIENNGKPIIEPIPENEQEKAAIIFGEGSPALTMLLRAGWKNGFSSFASCKGHGDTQLIDGGLPYIAYFVNNNNIEKMLNIVTKMSESKFCNFIHFGFYPRINSLVISFYGKKLNQNIQSAYNREDFFYELKTYIESENLYEIVDKQKREIFKEALIYSNIDFLCTTQRFTRDDNGYYRQFQSLLNKQRENHFYSQVSGTIEHLLYNSMTTGLIHYVQGLLSRAKELECNDGREQ